MTKKEILEQIYQYQKPLTLGQFLKEVIRNRNFDIRVKDLDFNKLFSIYTNNTKEKYDLKKILYKQFYPINFQEAMSCKIEHSFEQDFYDKEYTVLIDSKFCKDRYR